MELRGSVFTTSIKFNTAKNKPYILSLTRLIAMLTKNPLFLNPQVMKFNDLFNCTISNNVRRKIKVTPRLLFSVQDSRDDLRGVCKSTVYKAEKSIKGAAHPLLRFQIK